MPSQPAIPTIWDWPLRVWHWAFAALLGFSLASGWIGDIGLMEWHRRSGAALLGLLLFRAGWALWGGDYARWRHYRTTPAAFVAHFRGRGGGAAHTAPGIALVVAMVALAALQVGTGLFATDHIFTDGPLHRYASEGFADGANWLHHRLHWLIAGAVGIHLTAHAVYGFVLKDATPLAMFTGRKPVPQPGTRHFFWRATATAALAAAAAYGVHNAERWLS